jgi:2-keto-4-pentenoate hydratase/2-oxohepta-3-ene-1,7-dioic acid hydratase in catechol pathway
MRWIRFTAEGRTAYGMVEGDEIAEVTGDPFGGYQRTSRRHALAAVKIEVPVIPRTFYCAGLNYGAHVIEQAQKRGVAPEFPTQPDIGYRANNALIAHGETVIIPRDASAKVQYEGELVVVIGQRAKHLSEADALACVLGYTIGNDVSERSWQRSDRTLWRAIRFATNDMLFGVAKYLSTMSRYLTLYPGDVVWMGTDGASPDLTSGDVVEVEIAGIGRLRNPFLRES